MLPNRNLITEPIRFASALETPSASVNFSSMADDGRQADRSRFLGQGRYNGLLLNKAWSSGIPLYVVGAAARILGTGRRLRVWLWRPEHCLCSIKATGGGADCRSPAECKRHQNKSLHGSIAIDCCCRSMNRPALECHFAPSRNRPVLCRGITPP